MRGFEALCGNATLQRRVAFGSAPLDFESHRTVYGDLAMAWTWERIQGAWLGESQVAHLSEVIIECGESSRRGMDQCKARCWALRLHSGGLDRWGGATADGSSSRRTP